MRSRLLQRYIAIAFLRLRRLYSLLQKITAASKIAPGKAHLALSLVGYAEEVSQAMAYVFGDTMICDDAESAKAITFNKAIMLKSVTIQGDVYDPSGLLSGGSAPSGSGTLLKVQELNKAEAKLAQANTVLRDIEKEEASVKEARDLWKRLERELEIKSHEHALLEQQVGGSNAARVRENPFFCQTTLSICICYRLRRSVRKLRSSRKRSPN
jgi:structural maintenance of chromosome 2